MNNLGRQEDYFFTGAGPTLRWNGHRRSDGSEIHFSYNGQGQRLSDIDPLGNVTSYQRNRLGQLTALTQPDKQRRWMHFSRSHAWNITTLSYTR